MENKPLEQMTDDELLQLHAKEVGLDSLSDNQLKRLTELHANEPKKESGLGRAFAQSLPAAGGILGGGVGTLGTFGLGAVPMAAIGAAAGKAAENFFENLIYNEPKTREELYLGPVAEAIGGATGEMASPLVGKLARYVGEGITGGAKSLASSLSKIPEKSMEVYAERPSAVKAMGISAKTDDVALAEEANKYRNQLQKYIENFKGEQNAKITKAINQAGGDNLVDINKTISALETNIKKIDPILDPEKADSIARELDKIKAMSNSQGQVTARQAYDIGNKLQELADYKKMQNPLAKKDFVDLTFAKGASESRQALKKVVPGVSEANSELAKIRRMNATMNKNLITPDKPFQSLMGVGTGENQMNRLQMQNLGEVIGKNLLSTPEEMAAASYFNKAGILPREKTGSSMAPLILAGVGGATGGTTGYLSRGEGASDAEKLRSTMGGVAKGVALGSLGSPLAIKTVINTARGLSKIAPEVGSQYIQKMIQGAIQQGISPVMMDQGIKGMENLTSTEKAQLRKEITKGQ